MNDERSIGLTDLARETAVTVRTIRYYIAQGLLPSPVGQGPSAHYTERHADRIRLIKRLQREHLPLAEIRTRLAELDDDQVRRALDDADSDATTPPAANSALDYVRRVLQEGSARGPSHEFRPAAPPPPSLARRAFRFRDAFSREVPDEFPMPGETPKPGIAPAAPMAPPTTLPSRGLPTTDRSTWERIALSPDIELHVRRPLDRQGNRLLDRLLDYGRELFADLGP
jgi:DNA-binding transcriptional MerR regulator